MKNEVAVACMIVLCAMTCFAAWQVYRVAESIRPVMDAVNLVNGLWPG
jgi:hypothetical protein